MEARFKYNTYGPGRTRPHSPSEAHWRNLGVKLGLQMRRHLFIPPLPPSLKFKQGVRIRQKRQAQAAFLTPF